MSARVLLTGGSGFLATRVRPMLEAADREVITCDRREGSDLVGDLADPAFVRSLPDVDQIVHTAAVQYVSRDIPRWRRRAYFRLHNEVATGELAARYRDRVSHALNVGTSMMFAQDGRALYATDAPMRGEGVYSRSKLQAHDRFKDLHAPIATMVPCIIAGRGREGLFRGFVESMTRRNIALCPGTGDHVTQMVHVDDAAALLARLALRQEAGVFNAAGPGPLTIRAWIKVIAEELGLDRVRVLRLPYPAVVAGAAMTGYRFLAREQTVMLGRDHVLDTRKSEALGWSPRWTNEHIVRDTARYIAEGSPVRAGAA